MPAPDDPRRRRKSQPKVRPAPSKKQSAVSRLTATRAYPEVPALAGLLRGKRPERASRPRPGEGAQGKGKGIARGAADRPDVVKRGMKRIEDRRLTTGPSRRPTRGELETDSRRGDASLKAERSLPLRLKGRKKSTPPTTAGRIVPREGSKAKPKPKPKNPRRRPVIDEILAKRKRRRRPGYQLQ